MELEEFLDAEVYLMLALRQLDDAGVEAAELRTHLHNDLARIYNDRAGITRSAERHKEAEAELQKALDYQQRATSKVFFPHQLLPPGRRAPNRASSLEALRKQVIAATFRPRSEEQKARIFDSLVELCALVADEPQLNFGDPFKTIKSVIDWLDALIGKQINHILADPGFRKLESTWRGLDYLVRQTETGKDLKIKLFDLAESELLEAAECGDEPTGFRGPLFRAIYSTEFEQLGGEPYTAILCDFAFGDGPLDLPILNMLGTIGKVARTTFIAPAAPGALGFESWAEVHHPRDLGTDRLTLSGDNEATKDFRREDVSRHIVLTMPGVWARARYSNRDNPVEAFAFEEQGPPPLMSAGWALGVCITRACRTYGWPARIRGVMGGGTVGNLPGGGTVESPPSARPLHRTAAAPASFSMTPRPRPSDPR